MLEYFSSASSFDVYFVSCNNIQLIIYFVRCAHTCLYRLVCLYI